MEAHRVRVVLTEDMNIGCERNLGKVEWRTGQTGFYHDFSLFFISLSMELPSVVTVKVSVGNIYTYFKRRAAKPSAIVSLKRIR